jgi:hypothetical protein
LDRVPLFYYSHGLVLNATPVKRDPKEIASECGQFPQEPRKKRVGIFYPVGAKKSSDKQIKEAKHQTKLR